MNRRCGKDVMNIKIFILVFLMCVSAYAQEAKNDSKSIPWPNLSSLYYDYKARNALEHKNPELALEYELRVLENEPYSVQTHSNLGIIFDQLAKKEESGKSFDQALKILDQYKDQLSPADLFMIYYNLGLRYQTAIGEKEAKPEDMMGNVQNALKFYQMALDINPASTETKHNIELLIQQQQGGGGKGQDEDKKSEGDDQQKKDDPKEGDGDDQKKKDETQDRKQTPKYKPRAYKGEKLTEADVKKILGELAQQDKKIRSNYNKKDRKEDKNAKDW
jgi:Ca-activated chloride channel homolog